jgi:hypothetical protein
MSLEHISKIIPRVFELIQQQQQEGQLIMAIKRNAAPSGSYIKSPGEYRVKVVETKVGLNKKGKNMLTVTFRTKDDLEIAGYFVQGLPFHVHNLKELKTACGLAHDKQADQLVGRECGILVEAQEPDANGRVFMSITGYDSSDKVSGEAMPPAGQSDLDAHSEQIPF